MTPLESGAALVYIGDQVFWAPGTSASRVSTPDDRPVFEVSGASATGYLRTDAGDEYTGQGWTRTDPVELAYAARTPTRQLVYAVLIEDGNVDILPWEDAGASLLLWPESPAEETSRQRITVSAHEPGRKVPAGALPTTIGADFFDTDGALQAFQRDFLDGRRGRRVWVDVRCASVLGRRDAGGAGVHGPHSTWTAGKRT